MIFERFGKGIQGKDKDPFGKEVAMDLIVRQQNVSRRD